MGILKKITSKCATLEKYNSEEITLKLSNVDILSKKDVHEWKIKNLKLEQFNLSVQLPSKCNEKYLIKMFKNIEPVIDAEIIDLKQNNDSMTTYTFHYTLVNKEDESYIEKYIEGIGGKII